MRLSGVDPSIIRELSGIYKPFVKAFKELFSNAYDADATTINIVLARDFSSLEVQDNGVGLTPVEFYRDFARLGGSTAWQNRGRSPGGRLRIGYKGIGFLAVARYCSRMEIESTSSRPHKDRIVVRTGRRRSIDLSELLATLIPAKISRTRLRVKGIRVPGFAQTELKPGYDYTVGSCVVCLKSTRARSAPRLEIRYELSCADLLLKAAMDFDYLFSLERKADLQLLENFCEAEVTVRARPAAPGTRIRLTGLKDFVVRDLAASRHRGKGWNIASRSGKEHFLWRLARAAPIESSYLENRSKAIAKLRNAEKHAKLPRVFIQWLDDSPVELKRAIALQSKHGTEDSVVPIAIHEGGLRAIGYLLAQDAVLYPAELRGISVRVRNVAIGDSSFLGLERTLTGARKAALSQIGGEVIVLEGLDAADAINPGRESFYEENVHCRILKRALIGNEESVGGAVGQAIRLITDRGSIRGQVNGKISAARQRRKVLTDISSAVNTTAQSDAALAKRFLDFLNAPIAANGLGNGKDVLFRPVGRVAGFRIEEAKRIPGEFSIDFAQRRIAIDFGRDIWNHSIYLCGKYFEVCFRQGQSGDPMCEFDNAAGRIYVNWTHPVKHYMDEFGFLRSAIVWRLAYHLAQDSAEQMIDVALRMLAHRAE